MAKQYLIEENYDNENLKYKNGEDISMNNELSEEELSPEELIKKWYEEEKNYNYIEHKEFECDKFTQMIWKNSEKFGLGYYSLEEKKYSYVALYYPSGNKLGEYKDNVLNPKINENKNNINHLNNDDL